MNVVSGFPLQIIFYKTFSDTFITIKRKFSMDNETGEAFFFFSFVCLIFQRSSFFDEYLGMKLSNPYLWFPLNWTFYFYHLLSIQKHWILVLHFSVEKLFFLLMLLQLFTIFRQALPQTDTQIENYVVCSVFLIIQKKKNHCFWLMRYINSGKDGKLDFFLRNYIIFCFILHFWEWCRTE